MATDNQFLAKEMVAFALQLYSAFKRPAGDMASPNLHSKAFHVLFLLRYPARTSFTMTALAHELGISGPQLAKLIKPMEAEELVLRTHDRQNRRLVNISITKKGEGVLESQIECFKEKTIPQLEVFSEEEKGQLLHAIRTLSTLLPKLKG